MKDYQHISDEKLVKLALKKDVCFYALMRRYEEKLKRYVQRIIGVSYGDAEDIVQEVMIKVYQNLKGFDLKLKFSSWIYRIAHNEAISQYRKRKSRAQMVSLDKENEDGIKLIETLIGDSDIRLDQARGEMTIKIREALNKLPLKYQEVLILRFLEEKSYEEISDILKKSIGTISVQINRAKKRFEKIAREEQLESLI